MTASLQSPRCAVICLLLCLSWTIASPPSAVAQGAVGDSGGAADSSGPKPTLELGGHSSIVTTAQFLPGDREIVTGAADGTVRFWDTRTGEQLRVLRLAERSRITSLDVSQQAGKLFLTTYTKDGGRIVILSLASFQVESTMKIGGALVQIRVSPNGKLAAVARADNTAQLIDLQTQNVASTLQGHNGPVMGVAFSPDGGKCATASVDGTAAVYSSQTGERLATLRGHTGAVFVVAWSPDGSTIATGAIATGGQDPKEADIRLWTPGGSETKRFTKSIGGGVAALDFTRDSQRLCAVHGDGYAESLEDIPIVASMIDINRGIQQLKISLDVENRERGAINIVRANLSHDDDQAVVVYRDRAVVLRTNDGDIAARLRGDGDPKFMVGWETDAPTIVWNSEPVRIERNDLYKDLKEGQFVPIFAMRTEDAKRKDAEFWMTGAVMGGNPPQYWPFMDAALQLNSLDFEVFIQHFKQGEPLDEAKLHFDRARRLWGPRPQLDDLHLRYQPPNLSVFRRDEKLADLETPEMSVTGVQPPRSSTFVTKDLVVVDWHGLRLFDVNTGKFLKRLLGHSDRVTMMSPTLDGQYLATASLDKTVRVWNLDAPAAGMETPSIEPLVNLFASGNDWIAWTPEGYYAASPGGEKYLGYTVSKPDDPLLTFYPASRFRKKFFRPDVIKRLINAGSLKLALAEADGGEVAKVGENLPPKVEILSPGRSGLETKRQGVRVSFRATQSGDHPIRSARVLLNGRPLPGEDGVLYFESPDAVIEDDFAVPLVAGVPQSIQIRADSRVAYGLSSAVEVLYKRPPTADDNVLLPAMFVLAIGVANYNDDDLKLNFAADDARRLSQTLERRSGQLFKKVESKVIVDEQATREGILEGLVWLRTQMTQHDVGVIFFSGHGEKDEAGSFYLLPCDVNAQRPLVLSGVSDAQIKGVLAGIPGRLIVLLDACHAGTLAGDTRKNTKTLTDDLVRDLATDDYGVVVMASSMGREFSLEAPQQKSGAFTFALIEGIEGKADYNEDRHVYFNELDNYVSERVKEVTRGRQHPVTVKPATIRSFPIATSEANAGAD